MIENKLFEAETEILATFDANSNIEYKLSEAQNDIQWSHEELDYIRSENY